MNQNWNGMDMRDIQQPCYREATEQATIFPLYHQAQSRKWNHCNFQGIEDLLQNYVWLKDAAIHILKVSLYVVNCNITWCINGPYPKLEIYSCNKQHRNRISSQPESEGCQQLYDKGQLQPFRWFLHIASSSLVINMACTGGQVEHSGPFSIQTAAGFMTNFFAQINFPKCNLSKVFFKKQKQDLLCMWEKLGK